MDWLASHPPLEQPTKTNNTWKNKRKYVGPKYTSKVVQSDWHDSWKCLDKNPHLKIADETTSQGREVLSVYLQLLDFIADPSNEPNKARGADKHVWSTKNDWSVAVVKQDTTV